MSSILAFLIFVMCESTISNFYKVVGHLVSGWQGSHPLSGEVKVKNLFVISRKRKTKSLLQTASATNCLELACWSLLWNRAPIMAVCHWSYLIVRGHRSQLPEDSRHWVFLWKGVLLWQIECGFKNHSMTIKKVFLPNVSNMGSCNVHVNMRD